MSTISTIAAGPTTGTPILFIHGIAQSKKAFERLFTSSLVDTYRLVAMDLPGHGDSPAPEAPSRAMLADAVASVIAEHQLQRPWLAGWSFGGTVIAEYLRKHTDAALGGLLFLAGAIRNGREAAALFGPTMMTYGRPLLSEDDAIYREAARGFLRDAAHVPIAHDEMEAEMLRVPARVRRAFLAGGEDYVAAIAATTVPIATLHGANDTVVLPAMSDLVATVRPDVRAVRFEGAGHMPWLETPSQFDAAIRSIV